ncbi:MAG: Na+/H+ antiporter subunit C [Campylobacterales bacterium]|nr:Na+/H+ antiporter subunit C [Campylobacterales bacterium]
MEVLIALIIATLAGAGIFLALKARTYPVVLGLTMLTYAVNLFLFVMGRLHVNMPPVLRDGVEAYVDPVPQALVLTAIVISFGMTAFVIVLALRAQHELGNDHVDGAGMCQATGENQ